MKYPLNSNSLAMSGRIIGFGANTGFTGVGGFRLDPGFKKGLGATDPNKIVAPNKNIAVILKYTDTF